MINCFCPLKIIIIQTVCQICTHLTSLCRKILIQNIQTRENVKHQKAQASKSCRYV